MRRAAWQIDAGVLVVLAGASLLLSANFLDTSGTFHYKMSMRGVGGDMVQRMVLLWWGFGVPCALGFLLRRRWPLAAVGLAAVGAAGHMLATAFSLMPLDLALPIALYELSLRARSPWHSRVVTGALVLGAYAVITLCELIPGRFLGGNDTVGWTSAMSAAVEPTVFGAGLALVLAFALGEVTRLRRARVVLLEQRAADLERERDQRSTLAIAAERARITRELHDVVAHGLSMIVIQAQGAAAALHGHPERAEQALDEVIATGRASLAEMRRMLGVLRRDPVENPELAPQPGVGALPTLVDQVRAAGTDVDFAIDGEPVPLPGSVDLSAYRIVQEALTNVLKHAGAGARATIRIGFTPDQVRIEVHDDGAGPRPTAADDDAETGHGLRGIAERVGMLDGELTAGARPGGGFGLCARLPLGDVPAPTAVPAAPR